MEREAERQREGGREVVKDNSFLERQWEEEELQALLSVWDVVGVEHVAQSRATYELISERLRRLSVVRDWRECRAKCKSLGLQSRKPDVAAEMATSSQTKDTRPVEGWKGEVGNMGDEKRVYSSSVSVPMQKVVKPWIYPEVIYDPNTLEEGGRHWTDDEVRALLCVWANKRIRKRLKSTLRNKPIFQEMARRMQQKFGVIRNWKQCRTKYKNLKYDYKSAKSAHAAGGGDAGGPGKYMKYFEEVESILLDQGLENGSIDMQRRLYSGESMAGKQQNPAGLTGPLMTSKSEVVIEIQDEDDSDYHIDDDNDVKPIITTTTDPTSSDQSQAVAAATDTGRNWSDQEVQALVEVWADEHIRKQLESSTRKRDIFIQISSRLMQQGIERDWKQCHTKYKNLKYLYRSLQRGRTEDFDPRRIMRFYDQVDAIMNLYSADGTVDESRADDSRLSHRLGDLKGCQDDPCAGPNLPKSDSAMRGATKEANLVSSSVHDTASDTDDKELLTTEGNPLAANYKVNCDPGVERSAAYATNRSVKRKAVDEDLIQPPAKKKEGVPNVSRSSASNCKEEPNHIPIIVINSVCSMASTTLTPVGEVTSTGLTH